MFKLITVPAVAAAMLLAVTATPAHAYMGAGAGLSAIGSMLSFLGVMLLMVVGFVWFPLKRAIKRMTGKVEAAPVAAETQTADAETKA
ncbi:MAG: hypothetical protein JY451_04350 [Erythrobacter sp.]|nr:MAG: hypothetical protein JY451_04350 [Erythrobacter sp.]